MPDFDKDQQQTVFAVASRTYLRAISQRGVAASEDWNYIGPAKENVIGQIEADVARLSGLPNSHWPHGDVLGVVFPDEAALQAFVESHLEVLDFPSFFESWHESISSILLRERQSHLPLERCRELLNKCNLESVFVFVERLGIEYDSPDELLEDVYNYFVANRADTISSDNIDTLAVRLDSGTTAAKFSRLSRPNSKIYTDDVQDPFKEFLSSIESSPSGDYLFKSPEAKHGRTPYKYEATSFGGHAISIMVRKHKDGRSSYYFDIRGGGYSSDNLGQQLDRFAAYVGRDIAYPETPIISVTHQPSLPEPFSWGPRGMVSVDTQRAEEFAESLGAPINTESGAEWNFELATAPFAELRRLIETSLDGVNVKLERFEFNSYGIHYIPVSYDDRKVVLNRTTEDDDDQPHRFWLDMKYFDPKYEVRVLPQAPLTIQQIESLRGFNLAGSKI